MGLDQWASTRDKKGNVEEIAYWRKHNALDGWMESLWRSKGNDGSFNCEELELTLEDINRLQDVVENDLLPETQGFFFGNDSRFDENKKEITLEFIEDAKRLLKRKWWEKLLNKKKKVFYQNSW